LKVKLLEKEGIICKICDCKTDEDVIEAAKDADAIGVIYHKITGGVNG